MYATRGGFGAKRKENKEEVSEGLGCGRLNDLVCPVTGRRKAGVGREAPSGSSAQGEPKQAPTASVAKSVVHFL